MSGLARSQTLRLARLGGRRLGRALLGLVLLASAQAVAAQPAFTYSGASLPEVIDDIEARSGWRFLYRDALVATARVDLRATEAEIPSALGRALAPQGIGVEADRGRRQILLIAAPASRRQLAAPPAPASSVRRVRGRVVDAETGEALPFATVTWDDGRRGVVCDPDGAFSVELAADRMSLTASFVGYVAEQAALVGDAVTFRLRSPALTSAPIVIAAPLLDTPLDTAWATAVQRAGSVGEGGGLRALEALPSVAPGALFSDGTVVRGSAPDAFEVRLDGVPVYNPRHLFGLADAFNLDALRAVALHYGVAPARSAAPPGGTLEYITSAGSLRDMRVQAGVSSLGARASLDGPLRRGRTSALAAGRLSILGAGWGQDLVALGLGAETRTSPLPPQSEDALDLVLDVTGTSAQFWDLHLAAADEGAARRTTATAYLGGDRTALEATRVQRERVQDEESPIVERPVETRNRWGSGAFGLDDRRSLGARVALTSRLGLSRYHARFETDDFTYRVQTTSFLIRTDTLGYDNELVEAIWSEQLDIALGAGTATAGLEAHVYASTYQEQSISRRAFERSQTEQRLDLHAAWSGRLGRGVSADLGVRGHLYSASGVRVAPRVRLASSLSPVMSASVGVGRSHQFVHRITLGDVPAAAAWVLSATGEPPTEADHVEATLSARVGPASLHVGVYDKRTRDVRLHTETRTVQRFRDEGVLGLPWLPDVRSRARGLEALARAPLGPVALGAVYALTRTDLQHPDLDGGEPFRADWDRRHRLTLSGDASPGLGLSVGGAWTWATGTPNALADGLGEEASLPNLKRLDLRLAATRPLGSGRVTASLSVRNALDHDNVTVRDRFPLVQARAASRRLVLRSLDVYDAGRLLTLDIAVAL